MIKHIASSTIAAVALLYFGGCTAIPVQQTAPHSTPTPDATVKTPQSFNSKNGKWHNITVTIPSDNPAAQRYPKEYTDSYLISYMNAWNSAVIDRRIKYRAYDGAFSSPAAQANFSLYDGEEFDVEMWKLQLATSSQKTTDVFAMSDQTTAKSTGRTDGARSAKDDFSRLMLPQEKR